MFYCNDSYLSALSLVAWLSTQISKDGVEYVYQEYSHKITQRGSGRGVSGKRGDDYSPSREAIQIWRRIMHGQTRLERMLETTPEWLSCEQLLMIAF